MKTLFRAAFVLAIVSLALLVGSADRSGDAEALNGVVVALGAGGSHSCASFADSDLECWGANDTCQISCPWTYPELRPRQINAGAAVVRVDGGAYHSCALTDDGAVIARGFLSSGTSDEWGPQVVPGLESGVSSISSFQGHACAVKEGAVKCWGREGYGNLGAECGQSLCPVLDVPGLASGAVDVATGHLHSCAVFASGAVKCWGADGTTIDSIVPVDVTGLAGPALAVEAGAAHTCVLLSDGNVQCWGDNTSGQLGDGNSGVGLSSTTPVNVQGLVGDVRDIRLGIAHTCALTTAAVQCWGDNEFGEIGTQAPTTCPATIPSHGFVPCSPTPAFVAGLPADVQLISTGHIHTCAAAEGSVKCWGDNTFGQLGDGTTNASSVPVDVLTDIDDDGCADVTEQGLNAATGGQRNPKSFWDFFDTPDLANQRDRSVAGADIFRVLTRFNSSGDSMTNPLSAPPPSGYHTAFDRGAVIGPNPWNAGPADGFVAAVDIFAILAQFGHACP